MKQELVMDIGLHRGEDSDFYLEKGFRVVAVEADPDLAQACRERFAPDISAGRLTVEEGAITDDASKPVTFYKSTRSIWGTTKKQWEERNQTFGAQSEAVTVRPLVAKTLFEKYGVPHYLKLDIEGAEWAVLNELRKQAELPHFVSIESEKVSYRNLLKELRFFRDLGYTKFKVVQQKNIPGSTIKTSRLDGSPLQYTFAAHASGPFGDDLPGRWLTYRQACRRYLWIFALYQLFGDKGVFVRTPFRHRRYREFVQIVRKLRPGWDGNIAGWYDTHAAR